MIAKGRTSQVVTDYPRTAGYLSPIRPRPMPWPSALAPLARHALMTTPWCRWAIHQMRDEVNRTSIGNHNTIGNLVTVLISIQNW